MVDAAERKFPGWLYPAWVVTCVDCELSINHVDQRGCDVRKTDVEKWLRQGGWSQAAQGWRCAGCVVLARSARKEGKS